MERECYPDPHPEGCTALPLSCFRQEVTLGGFSCIALVSHYTPRKGPVAPVAHELPGVLHVKLPLRRCRATGELQQLHLRVSGYTVLVCAGLDASFLLTVEVFLLAVRLFYFQWGNRK